jgi:hypothetical protein
MRVQFEHPPLRLLLAESERSPGSKAKGSFTSHTSRSSFLR